MSQIALAWWPESLIFPQDVFWRNFRIRSVSRLWFVLGSVVRFNFFDMVYPSTHTLVSTIHVRVAALNSSVLLSQSHNRICHLPFSCPQVTILALMRRYVMKAPLFGSQNSITVRFHKPRLEGECRITNHQGWYKHSIYIFCNLRNELALFYVWPNLCGLKYDRIMRVPRKPTGTQMNRQFEANVPLPWSQSNKRFWNYGFQTSSWTLDRNVAAVNGCRAIRKLPNFSYI